MTATMTSRERIAALLRRELPDRMGVFEHFWDTTLTVWQQQGLPTDVRVEEFFDLDLRFAGMWGHVNPEPLLGRQEILEETDTMMVIRQGNGAVVRQWKDYSTTPEHIDFDCTTPEKWESVYKPPLLEFNPDRVKIELTREAMARHHAQGKFSCISGGFVFEWLRATLGDVCMLESLALEPEWIHDFCRTYTDFVIRHYNYLFDEAGQPDGAFIYDDMGYNKGLFCSPTMLRELILPYHKELVAYFHGRGIPVILHSCGNINEALPHILEAGFDCLQPMEAKAGVDVVELAKQYGDRISFMGNIDARILESGDKAAIEQEIVTKLEALKALGAAYIFHSDHSLSYNVSIASYQYALSVYQAHCNY